MLLPGTQVWHILFRCFHVSDISACLEPRVWDGFTTSFVSNTKQQFRWSCSPRSHRASEMLALSHQHLSTKSNICFGHSRELISFIITDNYFSSVFWILFLAKTKTNQVKKKVNSFYLGLLVRVSICQQKEASSLQSVHTTWRSFRAFRLKRQRWKPRPYCLGRMTVAGKS